MSSGIEITVDLSGYDRVLREEPIKAGRLLSAGAERAITIMKTSFNTSPAGRIHQRGTRTHTASQPGYPPNIDTGALSNSLRWEEAGQSTRKIFGMEYGLELEDSTMKNRPFIQPAFDQLKNEFPGMAKAYLTL